MSSHTSPPTTSRFSADGKCPDPDTVARVLVDDAASSNTRRAFLQHVQACDACRRLSAALLVPDAPAGAPTFACAVRTFAEGEVVCGRYVIQRFVDEGGMGEVYEAHDCLLGECVALKTVRALSLADEHAIERFKAEVSVARRVTHPNVCRILEFGVHERERERVPFFTMPFLRGQTLASFLRHHGPLHIKKARYMLCQIAGGLAAIHDEGIVHRDLKPDNIFVLDEPKDRWRLVVMDFGLARPLLATSRRAFSVPAAVVGTPAYVAPELLQGRPADVRSDLYSLGIVAFEMLAGRRPFSGETAMDEAMNRLARPALPLRAVCRHIPKAWDTFIARCLRVREHRRFANMAAFIAALPSCEPAASRPWQRLLWATAGVAAGGALAVAAWPRIDVPDVPDVPTADRSAAVMPAPPPVPPVLERSLWPLAPWETQASAVMTHGGPVDQCANPRGRKRRSAAAISTRLASADPDDVLTPKLR